MNYLCKDLIWYICFKLDNQSLLSFSLSSKRLYKVIFESELFWRLKYEREFPLFTKDQETQERKETKEREIKGGKDKYSEAHICKQVGVSLGLEEVKEGYENRIYDRSEISIKNDIRTIPNAIKFLPKLRSIRISSIFLSSFPFTLFGGIIPHLEKLVLSNNYIKEIPLTIINLTSLKHLYLSENMIRVFPKELCLLSTLETLDLSNNIIASIPDNIYKLVNLEFLDLSHNYIVYVPVELSLLKNLKILYLFRNQIQHFPLELKRLSLREVRLSDNRIDSIESAQELIAHFYEEK